MNDHDISTNRLVKFRHDGHQGWEPWKSGLVIEIVPNIEAALILSKGEMFIVHFSYILDDITFNDAGDTLNENRKLGTL